MLCVFSVLRFAFCIKRYVFCMLMKCRRGAGLVRACYAGWLALSGAEGQKKSPEVIRNFDIFCFQKAEVISSSLQLSSS